MNTKFNSEKLDDKSNLKFSMMLSIIAYKNETEIKTEIANLIEAEYKIYFIYGENIFSFVLDFENVLFIVFRGSQTLGDWISNLDIRVLPAFCGHIHRGFAKALESIPINNIIEIKENISEPKMICLTGHSRGGALAILGAALLKNNGYSPKAVYTFGQPKVGGKTFVDWWEKNMDCVYQRVVNGNDPIPRLPPGLKDLPVLIPLLSYLVAHAILWPFKLIAKLFHKIKNND